MARSTARLREQLIADMTRANHARHGDPGVTNAEKFAQALQDHLDRRGDSAPPPPTPEPETTAEDVLAGLRAHIESQEKNR